MELEKIKKVVVTFEDGTEVVHEVSGYFSVKDWAMTPKITREQFEVRWYVDTVIRGSDD